MPKHYYYDSRPFEIHELRLLMDAISAAKFISRNETDVQLLHEAIHDKHIVAFQYGRYRTDLNFHLSNEG
ncbi:MULTISPECIES: hypothetical protein [Sporosarcina]|uniref:Uncharacterized protein n=1 Tax=Sporosarcina contaminans TaxID=633403 RepID=A0ABW3U0H3_9BACL